MRISYREAKWLYENDCEIAVFYRDKCCSYGSVKLFRPIFSVTTLGEALDVLSEKYNIITITGFDSEKHPVEMMKTKLNSIYGRSCTMKMTHERYIAVDMTVTLIKCLNKGILEPNEKLTLATCAEIEKYYKAGYIDKALMIEIADKFASLKCQYVFDI